jgi:hypothetical protein
MHLLDAITNTYKVYLLWHSVADIKGGFYPEGTINEKYANSWQVQVAHKYLSGQAVPVIVFY